MTALAVSLVAIVALLAVLVAGLLRSHADILRALHSLGAGIGAPEDDDAPTTPIDLGRRLPANRGTGAFDVAGTDLSGDARSVAVAAVPKTLLAFLSSGCATCSGFWRAIADGASFDGVRLVVVTKDADLEEVGSLRNFASPSVDLVMSTQAWIDYEVPASPFFVLVDAQRGRIGEGLASSMAQLADLVRRAAADDRRLETHRNGVEREEDIDRVLLDAGIRPGDASLYPRRDVQR